MGVLRVFVILALVAAASPARGDPDAVSGEDWIERAPEAVPVANSVRLPVVTIENLLVIVPPTIYYWRTPGNQSEDWVYGWDWPSWRTKLTSADALILDTNQFEANGIRHPLVGALTYQIGRANGLGPIGATVMNAATSAFWEYVVEFKERPSFNDLLSNTAAGILVGEPLFQIGLVGDGPDTSPWRRALATMTSPFHHVQKELGLSPLRDAEAPAGHLDASVGVDLVRHGRERARAELRLGLDVEVMRDRAFGHAGVASYGAGFASWNRVAFELRVADGLPGARFASSTTYAGRTTRAIDGDGDGYETFVGIGGGFAYAHRDLPGWRDKVSVLSLVGPRVGIWSRAGTSALAWDLDATADLAMVQAHAFDLMPLAEAPSVLRLRGYYYATGVSARTRLRLLRGPWSGLLAGSAAQFWSYDDHSYGGTADPRGVADQRATVTLSAGHALAGGTLEVFADATMRRGTWQLIERTTAEVSAGVGVTAPF